MDIPTLRGNWDLAAREDALFNILTLPDKQGGGWDADEFFLTGKCEIDGVMERAAPLLEGRRRALDFGCGVGRATQALAGYFKRVDGCDVSPEMLERAARYNLHPSRAHYRLNDERLPYRARSFDLVYSMIVLQHMPPGMQEGYIREFLRVLCSEGLAVFHIPEGASHDHSQPWLSMYTAPRDQVHQWATAAGGQIVDVQDLGGNDLRYTTRKGNRDG